MTYNEIIARLPWTREQMPKQEYLVWVASRKQAGEGINVETCEIGCWVADYVYPYGTRPENDEHDVYDEKFNFVRSADSNGWVCESDLPLSKVELLYERITRMREERERGEHRTKRPPVEM